MGTRMISVSGSRKKARKHGIFVNRESECERSEFGRLALFVFSAHRAEEIASEIDQTEVKMARCKQAVLEQLSDLEAAFVGSDRPGPEEFETILHRLDLLFRYQSDCLNKVRKGRLSVLNAAEGIKLERKKGAGS